CLEGTYTGKTFAALVADSRSGRLAGSTVAFWLTYNSHDISFGEDLSIAGLPEPLRRYFSEPVQELDRTGDGAIQGDDAK
ncbi:MAG: hypothetical protein PF636_03175, partial [Actinomycetota bacterium]|nr:hypothetical protein [Actinomycetota bacterium]